MAEADARHRRVNHFLRELLAKHKVTLFAGVPTMYFALLHHPDAAKYDLSTLKYCASGGAAMPWSRSIKYSCPR